MSLLSLLTQPFAGLRRSKPSAVLVIGDAGYRILRFSGHVVEGSSEWPRDAAGRAGALAELRSLEDGRLHVLVDSMEQTYRREEIPAASIADRRRIVARRLDVAFPTAGLKRAVRLIQDRRKRSGPERYLFAALPDSEEVHDWVRTLSALERPVDGIGLLPLEVAARAARIQRLTGVATGRGAAQQPSWTLVVGRERTGGIRQIVLENNDLALTRLAATPPDDLPPAMLAAQIQRDIKSTLGYLARLGYRQGLPLTLLVIVDEAVREELLALPPPGADISLVVRTPEEALAILGFQWADPGLQQPWADPVFAALVAGDRLARPLVTEAMLRRRRNWMAMRGVRVAGACTLAGLALASVHQVITHFEETRAAARLDSDRLGIADTLDTHKRQLHAQAIDIDLLRKVMRARDYLDPLRQDFELSLDRILRSLGEEVRLVDFSWRRVEEDDRRRGRQRSGAEGLPSPDSERPLAMSLVLDLSRIAGIERAIEVTGEIARRLEAEFGGYSSLIVNHAVDILPGQALLGDLDGRSLEEVTRGGMQARIVLARSGE
ncbi:MAG: hypothetical protein R3C97_01115 [Geminicoccaceae bacterium]